ncbi:MAG: hypothetical protein RMJ75_01180 [Nitrososphaerota archaeon]|nr:hypothetical protein [Nitrososphaerota archaeon]
MIEDPGVTVTVSSPGRGRLDCLDEHAELVRSVVRALGSDLSTLDIEVGAPPLHVGLGTTTQLSLAVGMALSVLSGSEFDVLRVARLTGRGRRSWIGIAGFVRGGFVLDKGRLEGEGWAHDFSNLRFPEDWAVLLIRPIGQRGLSGDVEERAMRAAERLSTHLEDVVRKVIRGIITKDFDEFVDGVELVQETMGTTFSRAQGGRYHSLSEELVMLLREHGARGVGQSSWGPTVYGFFRDTKIAESVKVMLSNVLRHGEHVVHVTGARNRGVDVSFSS